MLLVVLGKLSSSAEYTSFVRMDCEYCYQRKFLFRQKKKDKHKLVFQVRNREDSVDFYINTLEVIKKELRWQSFYIKFLPIDKMSQLRRLLQKLGHQMKNHPLRLRACKHSYGLKMYLGVYRFHQW